MAVDRFDDGVIDLVDDVLTAIAGQVRPSPYADAPAQRSLTGQNVWSRTLLWSHKIELLG